MHWQGVQLFSALAQLGQNGCFVWSNTRLLIGISLWRASNASKLEAR